MFVHTFSVMNACYELNRAIARRNVLRFSVVPVRNKGKGFFLAFKFDNNRLDCVNAIERIEGQIEALTSLNYLPYNKLSHVRRHVIVGF